MAKKFEERLEAVRDAAASPKSAASRRLLSSTLRGRQGFLISIAATATAGDASLQTDARAAFERLCVDPIKRDPQCHGKVAIARTFYDAEIRAFDVFKRGVRHVQLEPVYGGRQDTAAELRGTCIQALVHGQHPRALVYAAERLADPERAARLAAIRALQMSGRPDVAEPLLVLRLEAGESDPEVVTDCMTALLRLDADENLARVAESLNNPDPAMVEAAALALGASRVEGAYDHLREATDRAVGTANRSVLFLALAMLRSDAAWQLLIEHIMEGAPPEATAALEAMATFKDQPQLRERVCAAVEDRADRSLTAAFERAFSTG